MTTPETETKTTPLNALHRELGGRMVPFAGYDMPVQFPAGIMKEHLHTREAAGLFDVSHMGQVRLHGAGAAETMERLVPVDVVGLESGKQRYAMFTDKSGCILDDLMITHAGDHLFVVVNAGCKDHDIAHMRANLGAGVTLEVLEEHALLALQGPKASAVLSRLAPEVAKLLFMTGAAVEMEGAACYVTRSGYSGEDGYEISVPADRAEALAKRLLAEAEVAPIGLGARDSLRLEAGLCLYGHDIDTTTTPLEAALAWALSKSRRADGARPGGYPGADVLFEQFAKGVTRRRVGLKPEGRAPVREGAVLVDETGREIGKVTSGGFGPTVGGPVAMGYVEKEFAKADTKIQAIVRGKPLPAAVTKMPFVAQRYYRG